MAASGSLIQGHSEWKKCHKGKSGPDYECTPIDVWLHETEMVNKMMTEKLKEAMHLRDRAMLEKGIEDCTASGVANDHPQMKAARRTLKVMDLKSNLEKAVANKDLEEIDRHVEAIVNGPYYKYLQLEVAEAEQVAELYHRNSRTQNSILDMDKRAMFELRRYPNPPAAVKQVMQASLLLLGEDESTTEEWKHCSKFLSPDGRTGLNKRIMTLDASDVHPEIAARAQEILTPYEFGQIRSVSAAAGTFYVWAMGVVDDCLAKNTETDTDQAPKPASKTRQRQILGRPPLEGQDQPAPFKRRSWRQKKDDPSTPR